MKNNFSQVPTAKIQRSKMDRSHGYKTLFDGGYLIPWFLDEVLPGDTHILNTTVMCRMSTPIVPIMDNIFLDFFFFFVPNRLVWDNFQKFMGERIDPGDSIDYTVPVVDASGEGVGTLTDYFGLPIDTTATMNVSALPYRCYNLIYNEWFRDQNLISSRTVQTGDGPDSIGAYTLQRRGKRHDYVTSSLPWPQKEGTGVQLPLGTDAPVTGIGKLNTTYTSADSTPYRETDGTAARTYVSGEIINFAAAASAGDFAVEEDPNNAGFPNIRADLSNATAANINDIREAFQTQRFLEKEARGGSRYTEIIRSFFGVSSPDQRLQRPEYLGGGSLRLNITPVAQTSSTDATTPKGDLSAFGVASGGGIGFSHSFTEHGIILGLCSARADLTYQNCIDRSFLRSTRYDFYWPVLAHLGEQEVENQEVWFDDATPANNTLTWGYQERYGEYKYKRSLITHKFRSAASGTLEIWHCSQDLSSPALNASFIKDTPDFDRNIATPSEPHFFFDAFNKYISVRPMPVHSVPGLIDHF